MMCLHPEIQRKVQNELDEIVGSDIPKPSSKYNLPYLEATLLEVQRYGSIVSLGLAHCAAEDTTLASYNIPKGNASQWSLCWLEDTHQVIITEKTRAVLLIFILCLNSGRVPGADHILAQPLKRWSASRIKPNETFELAKKTQNILCCGVCGVCGRKNFFTLSPSYKQSPKKRQKSLCSTVLQLRWVISTWWDENMTLCVFSACYEIHWNWFCGREQTKNTKIRKGACFSRRVLW